MKKNILFNIFVFIFILFIWFYYPDWGYHVKNNSLVVFGAELGTFGDYYGPLNALFSGFAFAGVLISIFQQSQQLIIAKSEMEVQSEQFRLQTSAMKKQMFETTFFQLLNCYSIAVSELNSSVGDDIAGGKKAVKKMVDSFDEKLSSGSVYDTHEDIGYHNDVAYVEFLDDIGHLFEMPLRHFIHLVDYVHSSTAIDDKEVYIDLIRAQVSRYEMYLILSFVKYDDRFVLFSKLIEKYALAKYLTVATNLPVDVFMFFSSAAYWNIEPNVLADYMEQVVKATPSDVKLYVTNVIEEPLDMTNDTDGEDIVNFYFENKNAHVCFL